MSDRIGDFRRQREVLNKKVLARDNINFKRFFGIDSGVYREGALNVKTKELLGLVASTVMRCDDCITYHLIRCAEVDVNSDEMDEAMAIALIAGGSITIPHLRRAYDIWEELKSRS
jgi:AhpD family alkylhydroperoxidase